MNKRKTDSNQMDEFRKHLTEFRISKGFNKGEFSREIGMSLSVIQKIEKGYKNPGYKFLKNLIEKYPEIDLLEWFGLKVVIK